MVPLFIWIVVEVIGAILADAEQVKLGICSIGSKDDTSEVTANDLHLNLVEEITEICRFRCAIKENIFLSYSDVILAVGKSASCASIPVIESSILHRIIENGGATGSLIVTGLVTTDDRRCCINHLSGAGSISLSSTSAPRDNRCGSLSCYLLWCIDGEVVNGEADA